MPYRLCAIDLDDTLLGPDHAISQRNESAVRAVVKAGVTVVIASGRMHEATLPYVEQLGLETPIISYNGAMVRSAHGGDIWLHERIPSELSDIVLDFCAERGLQLNFYHLDRLISAAYTPWLKLYHDRTSAPVDILPEMYETLRGVPPTKLIIVDSPEKTNALRAHFRDLFGDRLYVTKSNDEYLEFMPAQASKGAALALVAERLGIAQEETVAFGDSFNDLPMIRWAGLGVVVGNAKKELLEAADRVILRYDEDGVGIALEEIFQ